MTLKYFLDFGKKLQMKYSIIVQSTVDIIEFGTGYLYNEKASK